MASDFRDMEGNSAENNYNKTEKKKKNLRHLEEPVCLYENKFLGIHGKMSSNAELLKKCYFFLKGHS